MVLGRRWWLFLIYALLVAAYSNNFRGKRLTRCHRQLAAYPQSLHFTILDFPLASLYCNTLLGNLNARRYVTGVQPHWEECLQKERLVPVTTRISLSQLQITAFTMDFTVKI